jgi:putative MATE family efflux protein
MPKRSNLDSDKLGILLLKLTTPAFFGSFVMMLYNIINTIFVSRYVGPMGIAGLSIVFPLQMLAMGIGQMTGMGSASHISRLIGAHDVEKAEKVLGNAITLSVVLGLLITLIGFINMDFWLRVLGSSPTILPYAKDYYVIIVSANVISTFVTAVSALLIAEGNVRISMIGNIAGSLINILLCYLFVVVLNWGIKGSAWAAVLAQMVSAAYFLWYYLKQKTYLRILPRNLVIELGIIRGILSIGVSSFARTMAGSFSVVVINHFLINFGGDLELSSFGLVNRVMQFAILPGQVIGQGLQPILGYNYGAHRFDRVIRSVWIGMISATVFGILAFIFVMCFPRPIISIFTSDPRLLDLSVEAMKLVFLGMWAVGFMNIGSVTFQSLGKALQAFITALVARAGFLIPSVFILTHFLKINGVWLAFPVTDILSAVMVMVLMIPLIKQLQQMKKAQSSSAAVSAITEKSKV